MVVGANSQAQVVPRGRRPDAHGGFHVLPDEIVCSILTLISPRDVARLACASSVMYILYNEEPLWMNLCLNNENRELQYKGSWKRTTLHRDHLLDGLSLDQRDLVHLGMLTLLLPVLGILFCVGVKVCDDEGTGKSTGKSVDISDDEGKKFNVEKCSWPLQIKGQNLSRKGKMTLEEAIADSQKLTDFMLDFDQDNDLPM
ncbi:unnamed protein product [Lactuca saligna]|uniref:F-box domain-containing protein n=1 Tax=Lactuca saligna TaxID=75948 RepID=A0AA36EF30_LACSI|nr:unnamed protein product [Lactuca saligna]